MGWITAEQAPASATWASFLRPQAKTGTSHDAWFAGFTSNLLCIVWVGNDDYTDIKIEGAHAAAPIWAAFMKQASSCRNTPTPTSSRLRMACRLSRSTRRRTCLSDAGMPGRLHAAFLDGTAPRTPAITARPPQHPAKDLRPGQTRQLEECLRCVPKESLERLGLCVADAENFLKSCAALLAASWFPRSDSCQRTPDTRGGRRLESCRTLKWAAWRFIKSTRVAAMQHLFWGPTAPRC